MLQLLETLVKTIYLSLHRHVIYIQPKNQSRILQSEIIKNPLFLTQAALINAAKTAEINSVYKL